MKVYGFIYELNDEEERCTGGIASVSEDIFRTREEACAAMIESANGEIEGWNIEALSCDDEAEPLVTEEEEKQSAINRPGLGYWSLFEAELAL